MALHAVGVAVELGDAGHALDLIQLSGPQPRPELRELTERLGVLP
jgi:hypothetical protein